MLVELSLPSDLKRVWINPAHIIRLRFEATGETTFLLEIMTVLGVQNVHGTAEQIRTVLQDIQVNS